MTGRVASASFPAMSTSVSMMGVGIAQSDIVQAANHARQLAAAWEDRFSRFRPESLLCRLNAAGGQPIRADDTFCSLLEQAALAVQQTGGRFDPAILPVLEALGYDRSIEELRTAQPDLNRAPVSSHVSGPDTWAWVRIDQDAGRVSLPAGMRIDLGGIAKGAFVDLLAAEFAGWPGGSIDAGGDVVVWGDAPDGIAWHVGLEDPQDLTANALVVDVPAGTRVGLATSGIYRRRWQAHGHEVHHLIDPRTGTPASSTVVSVMALAETLAVAEVAAKAVLLAAANPPIPELFGASAAIVNSHDRHVELLRQNRGATYGIAQQVSADHAA